MLWVLLAATGAFYPEVEMYIDDSGDCINGNTELPRMITGAICDHRLDRVHRDDACVSKLDLRVQYSLLAIDWFFAAASQIPFDWR